MAWVFSFVCLQTHAKNLYGMGLIRRGDENPCHGGLWHGPQSLDSGLPEVVRT